MNRKPNVWTIVVVKALQATSVDSMYGKLVEIIVISIIKPTKVQVNLNYIKTVIRQLDISIKGTFSVR